MATPPAPPRVAFGEISRKPDSALDQLHLTMQTDLDALSARCRKY
ncbi:hypothetical protein [Streptomyces sp. NPDC127190]